MFTRIYYIYNRTEVLTHNTYPALRMQHIGKYYVTAQNTHHPENKQVQP